MALQPVGSLTVFQPRVRLGDPHASTDNWDSLSILFSMYEALVRHDGSGGYLPALAESWTVEEDARTWTFSLRHPVAFHNGDTLEADDVVTNLLRVCDPDMGGELGSQGVYRSYLAGAVIEAADRQTVRVVTPEPFADLLDLLVLLPIAPSGALSNLLSCPVGSGPYRFVEGDEGQLTMRAFAGYWGERAPVGEIRWRAEPDLGLRTEALLRGEADLIAHVAAGAAKQLARSQKATVVTAESSVCTIFMINMKRGVCTDRRVRQALNHALNVPELIDTVMEGAATPLNGPLTDLHFGCDPATSPYTYDPGRARDLLAEAGWGSGMRLVLDVPSVLPDEAPRLARRMAEQYAEVGITTEVREFSDRPGYAEMVRSKQIDDACCFDSSPLSTYRVLREKFHSRLRGPWWQGYANPEVDTLIEKAQATVDVARRREVYRQAYRLIRDDAAWIFLYAPTFSWGVGRRARGWSASVDGLVRFV